MADITHKIQMRATPAEVWSALTERAGLSGFWSENSRVEAKVDALADFRFGDGKAVAKMRVAEIEKGARVAWRCVDGPPDWIGTDITFDLAREGEDTVVRFKHRNWREVTDFMGHCSAKWAYLLFGLKSLLEMPEPDDLYV
jgi:uncharacterized protein YndB with AHSA1/START domain